ncbi:hypothetical protein ACF0H5_021040 [Mactra antiquata]
MVEAGQCFLLFFSAVVDLTVGNKWTFLPVFQELCPYSSFCETKNTTNFDFQGGKRPCCDSCSCQPGCEKDNTCCFENDEVGILDIGNKCMTPSVSNVKGLTFTYRMRHTCTNEERLCEYNKTDYKSFSPVVSSTTGVIYVNSECAFCNSELNIVPWQLSVACPQDKRDHSYDTLQLLRGNNTGTTGCYLSYVPPKDIDVESHVCYTNVIRQCNVSGRLMQWEAFWDHCPLFNATYHSKSQVYGNVFCYMCNEVHYKPISTECKERGFRNLFNVPFSAILDTRHPHLDTSNEDKKNDEACAPNWSLVRSYTAECRKIECPMGQFRLGTKCGFYSEEWIGGPFTAVLKLTPRDSTLKIPISVLHDLREKYQYEAKASWLKRNATKHWTIELLYKPSSDKKYIKYFMVFASHPYTHVHPAHLLKIMKQTITETWILIVKETTLPLAVQFNNFERYKMKRRATLLKHRLTIDEDYAYVTLNLYLNENDESYQLVVFPKDLRFPTSTIDPIFLNELFLCDQIELRPEEYLLNHRLQLLFKLTNDTLYEAEYRITDAGTVRVCLDRFKLNNNTYNLRESQLLYYVMLTWVWVLYK